MKLNFLTWATTFLFIGLILLMGRKYILRNRSGQMDTQGITKRLLALAVIIMAVGLLLLIPVLNLR